MIEIKYLSDEEDYVPIVKALKKVLGKHYTGALDKEKEAPYWVDAIAVYGDNALLDIRLFDPYLEVARGIHVSQKGYSDWLCHICGDEKEMTERGLSIHEINMIKSLNK
ncbi:MAG: hypothetical protein GX416_13490 [Bacteroidales bacterium]|nr:hypothetical protein [Bacteroidales bacterium]